MISSRSTPTTVSRLALTTTIRVLVVSWSIGWCGCATHRTNGTPKYETIKTNPNRDTELAERLTDRAARAVEHGKPEKAEILLQDALVADVTYGPAHSNLGQLYFADGDYYLAAWEFEYAKKLMPGRSEPLNNLGLVFEKVGKPHEAMEYFESAMVLDPTNPEIIGNLARVKLREGEKDGYLQYLLQQLLVYEFRPDWRGWAEEVLEVTNWSQSDSGELGNGSASPTSQTEPAQSEPTNLSPSLEDSGLELPQPTEQVALPAPQ